LQCLGLGLHIAIALCIPSLRLRSESKGGDRHIKRQKFPPQGFRHSDRSSSTKQSNEGDRTPNLVTLLKVSDRSSSARPSKVAITLSYKHEFEVSDHTSKPEPLC
jgi:hypothetical protein